MYLLAPLIFPQVPWAEMFHLTLKTIGAFAQYLLNDSLVWCSLNPIEMADCTPIGCVGSNCCSHLDGLWNILMQIILSSCLFHDSTVVTVISGSGDLLCVGGLLLPQSV